MPRGGKRIGAGRPKKSGPVSFETRKRIQKEIDANQIIAQLNAFIQGEIKMGAGQVRAALGLLRKVMPDLAAVAHSGQVDLRRAAELTDDEIATLIIRSRERTTEAQADQEQLH